MSADQNIVDNDQKQYILHIHKYIQIQKKNFLHLKLVTKFSASIPTLSVKSTYRWNSNKIFQDCRPINESTLLVQTLSALNDKILW